MTRKKFMKYLRDRRYTYDLEGDRIIVNMYNRDLNLLDLRSIPDNVIFKNEGDVAFWDLEEFPRGLEFRNQGDVYANQIESILIPVIFKNSGDISLRNVKKIAPHIKFENRHGDVFFTTLINTGIDTPGGSIWSKRVLNLAIKQGVFV